MIIEIAEILTSILFLDRHICIISNSSLPPFQTMMATMSGTRHRHSNEAPTPTSPPPSPSSSDLPPPPCAATAVNEEDEDSLKKVIPPTTETPERYYLRVFCSVVVAVSVFKAGLSRQESTLGVTYAAVLSMFCGEAVSWGLCSVRNGDPTYTGATKGRFPWIVGVWVALFHLGKRSPATSVNCGMEPRGDSNASHTARHSSPGDATNRTAVEDPAVSRGSDSASDRAAPPAAGPLPSGPSPHEYLRLTADAFLSKSDVSFLGVVQRYPFLVLYLSTNLPRLVYMRRGPRTFVFTETKGVPRYGRDGLTSIPISVQRPPLTMRSGGGDFIIDDVISILLNHIRGGGELPVRIHWDHTSVSMNVAPNLKAMDVMRSLMTETDPRTFTHNPYAPLMLEMHRRKPVS